MDREDFMDIVYSELESDPDNNRANRIIEAADEYAERRVDDALQVIESTQLGTNLADVGTDCISRQAAIDVFYDLWGTSLTRTIDAIKQLPSAQPEPCEDAVSREAVSSWLKQYGQDVLHRKYKLSLMYIWKNLMDLPPVTPKQRTGYWYPVGMAEVVGGESAQWGSAIAYHRCSECDEQALRDDFEQEVLSEWCPHCGAKMERVSE